MTQGLKSLGASADVSQLSSQLRGELLDAARAAALAAATHQVDALNDRLQGVTSTVGADELLDDAETRMNWAIDSVCKGGTVSVIGCLWSDLQRGEVRRRLQTTRV